MISLFDHFALKSTSMLVVIGTTLLLTQSALADATVIYEQTLDNNKANNIMQIKNGMIRFTPPNRKNTYSLYNSQTGSLTHVAPAEKKYLTMDEHAIAQQANLAKKQMEVIREQMATRMKDMPEAQRKQAEQMMENYNLQLNSLKEKKTVEQKVTSQTRNFAGLTCTVHETYVNGIKNNEMCITDAGRLGISDNDAKALISMQQFMKRMQKVAKEMMGSNMPDTEIRGIPLQTVLFTLDGRTKMETRMVSITSEPLKDELITIPQDYSAMSMPGL
jgi:hypothetical protein